MLEEYATLKAIESSNKYSDNPDKLNSLDSLIKNDKHDSFLKKAFEEEKPTMINHLIAAGAAISLATGFSHFAPEFIESDAAISGIATVLDATGYWGVFIPQLLYRDRHRLKNDNGKFDLSKIAKKTGEYASYIGILEGVYAALRFTGQYSLQKKGWDPAAASALIQGIAVAFFTVAWPIIRYGVRQVSEK